MQWKQNPATTYYDWHRKFAWFPKQVGFDAFGQAVFVWGEYYEWRGKEGGKKEHRPCPPTLVDKPYIYSAHVWLD
jgi:hypothetical protein